MSFCGTTRIFARYQATSGPATDYHQYTEYDRKVMFSVCPPREMGYPVLSGPRSFPIEGRYPCPLVPGPFQGRGQVLWQGYPSPQPGSGPGQWYPCPPPPRQCIARTGYTCFMVFHTDVTTVFHFWLCWGKQVYLLRENRGRRYTITQRLRAVSIQFSVDYFPLIHWYFFIVWPLNRPIERRSQCDICDMWCVTELRGNILNIKEYKCRLCYHTNLTICRWFRWVSSRFDQL